MPWAYSIDSNYKNFVYTMRDLDANFNVQCVLKMNTPTQ